MDDFAPPPLAAPSARRIRRLAGVLRAMIAIGALLLLALAAALWVRPDIALREILEAAQIQARDIERFELARTGCTLWMMVPLVVAEMVLLRLWQLFGEYRAGRIFGARALAALRGFSAWTMAAAVLSPLHGAVLSVLATMGNAPGHRTLTVHVSSNDYALLLFGAAMLAISGVMAEAARLAEDNAGFV